MELDTAGLLVAGYFFGFGTCAVLVAGARVLFF